MEFGGYRTHALPPAKFLLGAETLWAAKAAPTIVGYAGFGLHAYARAKLEA